MIVVVTEDNETIEVSCTKKELDARVIQEDCGGYNSPGEFYEANNIFFKAPSVERLNISQLIGRWF